MAIMVVSVVVLVWNNASDWLGSEERMKVSDQIRAFNTDYEAFNKKLLRATDVISIINKAENNNRKYAKTNNIPTTRQIRKDEVNEPNYFITIEISFLWDFPDGSGSGYLDTSGYFSTIRNNETNLQNFKENLIFDCTTTGYNTETGRINYMKFVGYDKKQIIDNS